MLALVIIVVGLALPVVLMGVVETVLLKPIAIRLPAKLKRGGIAFVSRDTSKRGTQDGNRINLNENYEVRYWSEKFRLTPDQLHAAVQKVGNLADAVERELKRAA